MAEQHLFKWRHFQAEIILLCVHWYLRYALSYRDLEEMMIERGLSVDHTTIFRWVQTYAPELEKRFRPHLKATTDSWRVDETSIKIKKVWFYLYRAVDSAGDTIEFFLSPTRDAEAATHFFCKTLHVAAHSVLQACLIKEQVAQPTTPADFNTTRPIPRVSGAGQECCLPQSHCRPQSRWGPSGNG
jgi:transposase, IS6 family